MKLIAKFLLAMFSFAPLGVSAGPVSQTAGNNLTGYNGAMGSVVGNQWNNAMNPRSNDQQNSAKTSYANCEAVVLRCATPKCSGGGCASLDIATPIVVGCVNKNTTCKQYGDQLVNSISGQLVSDSVALVNAQNAASQDAANQNAQQIANMQQQMQMQMEQMQEQSNAKIDALQSALEESQRSNQEAMVAAQAASQANSQNADSSVGLTSAQEAAAKSGVSEDVIARATITGQILTSMEGVESSLDKLKTTMRDAFRYAGCNEVNGNNCNAPKRVAKFRELANKFFEPYDALVDNLEDSLIKAQSVGVDMGDIYMMLSGSCNRWGEYLCNYPVDYSMVYREDKVSLTGAELGVPNVVVQQGNCVNGVSVVGVGGVKKAVSCVVGQVIPPENLSFCTLNKVYNDSDSYEKIQEKWLYPDEGSEGVIRIGCASDIMNSGVLKRRGSSRSGSIDIDVLELLINQDISDKAQINKYCAITASTYKEKLKSATISKNLGKICCDQPKDAAGCVETCEEDNLAYVNPIYALCSVHAYNANKTSNVASEKEEVNEIIKLKTTVLAQQMYKQYVLVESMIKRLKVQLEKAALKSSLQVASGTDDAENSSNSDVEFANCEAMEAESALSCIRGNYNKLKSFVDKGKLKKTVVKQIVADCKTLKNHIDSFDMSFDETKCNEETTVTSNKTKALDPIMNGITILSKAINAEKKASRRTSGY